MQKFGSAAQVGERYGVAVATVWRWAKAGIIQQPIKISEGCSRFDLEAIDQKLAERSSDGVSEKVQRATRASLESPERAKEIARRRRGSSNRAA